MKYLVLAFSEEAGWQKMSVGSARKACGVRRLHRCAACGGARWSATAAPSRVRRPRLSRPRTAPPRISDGPHLKGSDQLTGVYVLDVPDLATAVSWAERNPAARFGVVEVRPVASPGG